MGPIWVGVPEYICVAYGDAAAPTAPPMHGSGAPEIRQNSSNYYKDTCNNLADGDPRARGSNTHKISEKIGTY